MSAEVQQRKLSGFGTFGRADAGFGDVGGAHLDEAIGVAAQEPAASYSDT
jgi:hypothetical protein